MSLFSGIKEAKRSLRRVRQVVGVSRDYFVPTTALTVPLCLVDIHVLACRINPGGCVKFTSGSVDHIFSLKQSVARCLR